MTVSKRHAAAGFVALGALLASVGTTGQTAPLERYILQGQSSNELAGLVRVLGGTATIVPPQGKVVELFGIWNAEAELKASGKQRSLKGFFREINAADMPEQSQFLGAVHSL